MQKFTSLRLRNLVSNTGLMKLGLVILACFAAEIGRAQFTFATAANLSGYWGSVTNDNTSGGPEANAPQIAGFANNAPLWYQWTAPVDGEVELDTIGSMGTSGMLDTVLGVFTGTSLSTLNQVAANDDLFPINSSIPQELVQDGPMNRTGSGDYAWAAGPDVETVFSYIQPYYGPSHLRFNAKAATTYYFAVDTKSSKGSILLNWAYKSSGVFRFATEDVDLWSGLPLYQAAQTESAYQVKYVPVGNAVLFTYYNYNVPGVLVTVTRVAGSTGRCTVDYQTVDGNSLPFMPLPPIPLLNATNTPYVGAVAGVDYVGVTNTLVFDDYEMSKTILIPILYPGINGSGGYTNNTVFGVELSSPGLDEYEYGPVAPPRVDPIFSLALVKILNVSADPYGPDRTQVVSTNATTPWLDPPTNTIPNLETNYPIVMPTNPIVSFQKCNFRVPEDVNDPTNTKGYTTPVTIYVARSPTATNTSAITMHYRINNYVNSDVDAAEEWNNWFPLQPGSDYAVPTPPNLATILATNSDFDMVPVDAGQGGTISFPANGVDEFLMPITFTVTNSTLTKFNRDFKIQLYQEISYHSQTVPALAGMVAETTVTILFNDQHPPAGSVDELYNPDFGDSLALPPEIVFGLPSGNGMPGVSGLVNSLLVLPNNETLIAGDFPSYNGNSINSIALVDTNGVLDPSFDPGSGPDDGPINSVALTPDNKFVVGGNFSSFNGELSQSYVVRLNANGSFDLGFNASADDFVRAVAVQPDGKVLIGGDFQNVNGVARNYLARLNADGSLDTTFDPGTTLSGPVYAIALPPSVIAAINRTATGTSNEDDQVINIGNYTSGTLNVNYDMAFAPDDMRIFYGDTNVTAGTGVLLFDTGLVSSSNTLVIPFGPTNGLTTNIITIVMNQGGQTFSTQWKYKASAAQSVTSSGIIAGGVFAVNGQSYHDVAKFNSDGSLDTTFSPLSGADDLVYALGWQLDGKVVVGGAFTHFNGIAYNRLARLNPDGSLDTASFFPGLGADDTVKNITLQPLDGTMYVGGQFSSFNGTHRLGFTRLYANGTVDTTFLDTAYNQFAGLKKIYSDDTPAVYASGVQSDGNVIIGGTFYQVGGGQASASVRNYLDVQLGIPESFGDPNLWVEPKARDGVRNRQSIARLIGGSTPGPGNISMSPTSPYSVNRSSPSKSVFFVRTNGILGPVSANFSVQPGTAQSGADYLYDGPPPLFWIAWRFTTSTQTRLRSDGLFGGNGSLRDIFAPLSQTDSLISSNSFVMLNIIKDPTMLGDLNAQFQLANPSGADEFYLGGQNIPLGAALGVSTAPFTLIDDSKNSGTFGFISTNYVATNIITSIEVVRSNGVYGTVSMRAFATNGTAIVGIDYKGLTNKLVSIAGNSVSNFFTITNILNGLSSTNFVEKTVFLHLNPPLSAPVDGNATIGISNAVLRLINPNFRGYLTLSAANYTGSESAGFITFVVNRVAGSADTLTVQYATTDGPSATNKMDYFGATNTLNWNNGDASSRTISIALTNPGAVGPNKQFSVSLFNPTQNGTNQPALFYVGSPGSITNATLTITNDNSYGVFQFSAPSYVVREDGRYVTITVLRTGGIAAPVSVKFYTSDGPNAVNGVNYTGYTGTSNVLNFVANQTAASFNVAITNIGAPEGSNAFYFNVYLTNAFNAGLVSPSNAVVNILDANYYIWPPGSLDGSFTPVMNGDVLALALQPNGQILAGGNFTFVNGAPDNGIARLNTDGSLDSAGFLNNGLYSGATGGAVQAVVCQTDGRVIFGGAFNNVDGTPRNCIARLMTDGSLDTSFNSPGGASAPVYALAETFVNGAREIYVGGAFNTISGGTSPNLARLYGGSTNSAGGSLDTSFATGSGPNGAVYALAVYPTNSPFAGKLLVGGAFASINGFALGHVARMNGDGSVDTNFDLNLGANGTVRAIAIQSDGRILIGGDFTNVNGTVQNHIARLNSDGSLDDNFRTNMVGGANGSVQAIAVQADNRIVLAGQFTRANGVTRNRITRLLPNGAVDPTVNFGDGANGAIDALVIQPAYQMFFIGGDFTQYDDQPAAHIARVYGGSATGSGAFEFTSASYQADENSGQAFITVRRTGGTSGPNPDGSGNVSVQFATVNGGSAVAGVNYSNVVANLNFPPGEVFETVAVPVKDDGVVTTNPLTVSLAITNLMPPAVIGAQPTATLTIINDESAVSFLKASDSVTKNVLSGFATLDVIRSGATFGTCSVDLITTTAGSATPNVDFYPTNTTITFYPGETDKQIQVAIIPNTLPEGYRTVIFALTNVVNTLLYSPSNETLTIIDTVNAPGQLYFAPTNYVVNEGDGSAVITVLRTNGTTGHVTVTVTLFEGTAKTNVNYNIPSSSLVTFEDGFASATFSVPLVDNNLVQGPVSFSAVLSSPTGGAELIAPTSSSVTILDNDTGFAFAAATNTVSESAAFVAVNVLRIGDTSTSNSVRYTTVNGTATNGVNYQSQSNTLAFAIGESVQSIHIPLIDDPRVTGDLNFTIVLSNPGFGVIGTPGINTVVVQDADAGLSFLNSASSVYKNAGNAVITVVCSNPGVEPLSVHYSTSNGTAVAGVDYTATSGTLVFTGGVGMNTFSVPILTNSLVNGDHTFNVSLSNPTPPGQLVSPSNQVVTIIDSNSGLSFSSPTYTVLKTGVAATITVLRFENTNTVSSVNFATANGTAVAGSDYNATNGTCVFTNGETSKTFSVFVINNTIVQPDKTVLLQLSSPTNGILIAPYGATLTIHDTSGSLVVPAGSTLISESGPINGIIDPGETVSLWFAFRAAGGNDVTNLYATLLNINGVTNASPSKSYGRLTVGGPSASQSFSFKAAGTNSQQILATFQLTNVVNGVGTNLGTASFTFTLGTSINTFANTNLIIINDHASASPYPSTINVGDVGGLLVKATVTFANLTHSWPADIDALLESPSQQSALLMTHAGGGFGVHGVTLTFDDAASAYLQQTQIVSGTYKPTAFILSPTFYTPAPAAPYATNLSSLYAGNPNGAWSLFVIDDAAINAGAISNGWSLTLITSSPVGSAADVGISMTASPSPASVSNNLTFLIAVTNYGPSPSAGVIVTDTLPAGVTFISATGLFTHNGAVLTWNVGSLATNAGTTLSLVVLPTNSAVSLTNSAVVGSTTPDFNPDDNSASIVVTVGVAQTPQFGSLVISNGTVQFTVTSGPAQTNVIQASTNLINWIPIYTNVGSFTFTNAVDPYPFRFYRDLILGP